MPGKYETFDRNQLKILPLSQREHLMDMDFVLKVGETPMPCEPPGLPALADAIAAAHRRQASVILMMGAHVIKQGLGRYICDLIRRKLVSVVAMNGACAIHDYELARIGQTSEDVPKLITEGQFGLWKETAELNDIVNTGNAEGLGFGEAVGRFISGSDFPHKDVSVFAAAWESDVPATVHVGVGYDIVHEHPNCDGAATGEASYRDFLIFTKIVQDLEAGVVMCYGSAVMAPEVFLKALSMARNVAPRSGREIRYFTTAVFDLVPINMDIHTEAPKDTPEYYYRPYKTLLVRTVRSGGSSYYIRGDHRETLPALHRLLVDRLGD